VRPLFGERSPFLAAAEPERWREKYNLHTPLANLPEPLYLNLNRRPWILARLLYYYCCVWRRRELQNL